VDNIYFDEILLTHVGAPVAWRPRIIDTADTAVATPLFKGLVEQKNVFNSLVCKLGLFGTRGPF
jgi:hypothetical protein